MYCSPPTFHFLPDPASNRSGRSDPIQHPLAEKAILITAGYDLTHLFVGAEGTLGVITEITLRIQGVPEAISAAVVGFGSFEAAIQAVTQVRQIGVPIARIEFLDEITVKAVNQFSGLTLVEQPSLFLEFHGSNASVKDNVEQVGEIMREFGGSDFQGAVNQAERTTLWTARHNAYYASLAYRPGCRALTTDVCVPISQLAECIAETKRDLAESFLWWDTWAMATSICYCWWTRTARKIMRKPNA